MVAKWPELCFNMGDVECQPDMFGMVRNEYVMR